MSTNPQQPSSAERGQAERRIQLERRRLLLRGLAKGSAVAAAATPLQSLATGTVLTGTNMLCTASGIQSAVRSNISGASYCGGHGHSKYKKQWISGKECWPNWPGYNPTTGHASFSCGSKTVSTSSSCKYNSIFPLASSTASLVSILEGGDTSERVWVTALLNSEWHLRTPSLGLNYPYAPGEVLGLHGGSQHADATTLFRSHLMQKP